MSPCVQLFRIRCGMAAAIATVALMGGCDVKPSTPPAPKTSANEGPTAAGGGPPSSSYPAGIKPAASGDQVADNGAHKGPSEGATAVGGVSSGQAGGAGPTGGAPAPTHGDGATAPK